MWRGEVGGRSPAVASLGRQCGADLSSAEEPAGQTLKTETWRNQQTEEFKCVSYLGGGERNFLSSELNNHQGKACQV